jgi:hypothetical protein
MDSPAQRAEKPFLTPAFSAQNRAGSAVNRNGGESSPTSQDPAQPKPALRPDAGPHPLIAIMRIVLFAWVGILLAVLPWQDRWIQNTFLIDYPLVRVWLAKFFVRGAFTGLGIVNLWIAVSEAIRFRLR